MDGSPEATTIERGESVRERMLAVARARFAEKGFSGTSVREIADGVGVTVPALYYHFGSKRGLLLALVEDHCAAVTAAVFGALDERAGEPGSDAAAAIAAGLEAYIRTLSALAGSTLTLRDPSLYSDPEIRGLIAAAERSIVGRLAEQLERGSAAGDLRPVDPGGTAMLLMAAARGVHVSRGLWGGAADGADPGPALARLVLDGLRA